MWSSGSNCMSLLFVLTILRGFIHNVEMILIFSQEAIAVGRSFASMKGYHLDGNKEMIAMGFMNIVGSLTSCYTATGKSSIPYTS